MFKHRVADVAGSDDTRRKLSDLPLLLFDNGIEDVHG